MLFILLRGPHIDRALHHRGDRFRAGGLQVERGVRASKLVVFIGFVVVVVVNFEEFSILLLKKKIGYFLFESAIF